MEMSLEEAIFYSKLIIKNGDYYSGKEFRKYSKGYIGTTENIRGYLDKERFNKENALTVLGGGDHVFNLAYSGVKTIDAFDINCLEYFVYFLRKAMIEVLSYEEFLDANSIFFSVYLDRIKELLLKLKNNLREDVYEYYRILLEFCKRTGRLENLYHTFVRGSAICNNNYLLTEESYLSLREKMRQTKVNLYFGDARTITRELETSYDIILLSNISDYLSSNLSIEDFKKFIAQYYRLLNEDGIVINYLYFFDKPFIIKNSSITKENLGKENVIRIGDEGYYRVRKVA